MPSRPYRKAHHRALSRKRIRATRWWYGDNIREVYAELLKAFGIGSMSYIEQGDPYKNLRRRR